MRKIRLKSSLNAHLAEQFERDLNDSQRAAVTAPDGYNLILAGPGSGKTRVITYRVAYLIASGVPPESIMLVTFTRRAAREMVRRMELLIGHQAGRVWAGTFHHIGNRLLRRSAALLGYQSNFTILDSEDQLRLLDKRPRDGHTLLLPTRQMIRALRRELTEIELFECGKRDRLVAVRPQAKQGTP